MMNVIRFWLSTVCRKPNGTASIDCRTVVDRAGGVFTKGLFDQRLGHVETARPADHVLRIDVGELDDDRILLFAADGAELGDLDRDGFHLLRSSLASSCAACSCGRLISSTAALRRSPIDMCVLSRPIRCQPIGHDPQHRLGLAPCRPAQSRRRTAPPARPRQFAGRRGPNAG